MIRETDNVDLLLLLVVQSSETAAATTVAAATGRLIRFSNSAGRAWYSLKMAMAPASLLIWAVFLDYTKDTMATLSSRPPFIATTVITTLSNPITHTCSAG
jgi:hypothetical protein